MENGANCDQLTIQSMIWLEIQMEMELIAQKYLPPGKTIGDSSVNIFPPAQMILGDNLVQISNHLLPFPAFSVSHFPLSL